MLIFLPVFFSFFFFFLDAPKVTMPTRTLGYYLQPGQILCSVESFLPFTLSFMRDGIALGVDQYLRCVNVPLSSSVEPQTCKDDSVFLFLTSHFFPLPSWNTALGCSCGSGRRQNRVVNTLRQ